MLFVGLLCMCVVLALAPLYEMELLYPSEVSQRNAVTHFNILSIYFIAFVDFLQINGVEYKETSYLAE